MNVLTSTAARFLRRVSSADPGILIAWLCGLTLASTLTAPAPADEPPAAAPPVILLTGFQPFGEGRPPNPSWEAIKSLRGRTWNGYRIECLELPVEWGEPRNGLEEWLSTHDPVAVFSFGQGHPDTFEIEDVAYNRRANAQDNSGDTPPAPKIVAGGPPQFASSFDTRTLLHRLARRGYPVRLSADAGAYLCEELLYTLEHLRSEGAIKGDVLFCHVPPLGAIVQRRIRVTPEYVQRFVLDVLESWHTARLASTAAESSAAPTVSTPPAEAAPPDAPVQVAQAGEGTTSTTQRSPREAAVEKFIRHYFDTWSKREMDAYARCFHPEATIHLLEPGGKLNKVEKGPFVDWQRQMQQRATTPMVEVPLSIKISFEQEVARAEVHWRLIQGDRIETGYDHFTLVRQGERWLILHLLFYSDKK